MLLKLFASIICVFLFVGVGAGAQDWPAPEVIIKEWRMISTVVWSPGAQPFSHFHDFYYIDPSGMSRVEIACHTTDCPRGPEGGASFLFVYRTKDRELRFLEFNQEKRIWEEVTNSNVQWIQQWHDDFDTALKVHQDGEGDEKEGKCDHAEGKDCA